jgi:hypothetical protein
MNHKILRLILINCLLLTTFFIGGTVYAQDEELPDPGITPDSPFYFFDKLTKNIGMFFTFGDEAKAEKALRYAEERLSEARAMALKNKVREMTRAANEYEGFMAMVNERLEAATRNSAPDILSERLSTSANHIHTRLGELKDKLPPPLEKDVEPVNEETREEATATEEARATIEHARAITFDIQVNALRILGENKPEKALDICADAAERHLERVRTSMAANLVSENVIMELDFAIRIAALEEELISIADEKGIDVAPIMERLTQSTTNRLEVLTEVYTSAPASARQGIGNAIENSVEKHENIIKKLESENIHGNLSINVTPQPNIPAQIQESLDTQISNQEQTINDTPANVNAPISTENQLKNQEQIQEQNENQSQLSNTEPQMSANQTLNQQNQDKNNKTND